MFEQLYISDFAIDSFVCQSPGLRRAAFLLLCAFLADLRFCPAFACLHLQIRQQ